MPLSLLRSSRPVRRTPAQARSILAKNAVKEIAVILTAAATLHAHGISEISTSAQAAKALEPLAGRFAFLLFVCGIVGTGLLAVPVLAASACYGIGEACRWKSSLERKSGEAVRFHAAIAIATLIGLSLNLLHIDPVKALFWAAILNGVAAPLMAVIMLMASRRKRTITEPKVIWVASTQSGRLARNLPMSDIGDLSTMILGRVARISEAIVIESRHQRVASDVALLIHLY